MIAGDFHASIPYVGQLLKQTRLVDTGLSPQEYANSVSSPVYMLMASMLQQCHCHRSHAECPDSQLRLTRHISARLFGTSPAAQAMGWDENKINKWVGKMVKGDDPPLRARTLSPDAIAKELLSILPIAELDHIALGTASCTDDHLQAKLIIHCSGVCSPLRLANVVGAPMLPTFEPVHKSQGYPAYAVRKMSAFKVMQRLLTGETSPLMKAFVVKNMFIY